jgi:DNA-binding transcriptional regulator/RsmH inhibitor MraZ
MYLYGAWVTSVHKQHRIRLEGAVFEAIRWLQADATSDGILSIGATGQLQLSKEPLYSAALHRKITSGLEASPLTATESADRLSSLVRFMASNWPVTLSVESARQRVTFVIPKAPRDLGIAPQIGESVVVFVSGDIVEIWKRDHWLAYAAATRQRLTELADHAVDDLSRR